MSRQSAAGHSKGDPAKPHPLSGGIPLTEDELRILRSDPTARQRFALEKLLEIASGRSAPLPAWDEDDVVVGTRTDVLGTGIRRTCSRCLSSVYTSQRYPDDVLMVCDVCFLAPDADAK